MRKDLYFRLHSYEETTDPKRGKKKRVLRYTGPLYPIDLPDLRRRLPVVWAALALAAAAFVTAGFTPALGQRKAYVLIPFVLTLLPLYFGIMAAARLTRIRSDRIDEILRREGVDSAIHSALGLTVLAAAWLVCEIVLMCQMTRITGDEWLFLCCAAAAAAGGALLMWRLKGLRVSEAEQPDSKKAPA